MPESTCICTKKKKWMLKIMLSIKEMPYNIRYKMLLHFGFGCSSQCGHINILYMYGIKCIFYNHLQSISLNVIV